MVLPEMLPEAEELAKLPKLDSSLWQAYRRGWATARKGLPLKDVAAVGGWKDIQTLVNCYQQADDDTMLLVMSHPKRSASECPVADPATPRCATDPETDALSHGKKNPDSVNSCRGEI
ncbi:MAG: hypothetical protein M3Z18_10435 [Gemmatimonadota bacterium]|nr:hypothetical protein [Gemmatimonadota bacterium]